MGTEFLYIELTAPDGFSPQGSIAPRSDSVLEPKEFLSDDQVLALANANTYARNRRATRGIRATRTKTKINARSISCRGIPEQGAPRSIRFSVSDSDEEYVDRKVKTNRSQSMNARTTICCSLLAARNRSSSALGLLEEILESPAMNVPGGSLLAAIKCSSGALG